MRVMSRDAEGPWGGVGGGGGSKGGTWGRVGFARKSCTEGGQGAECENGEWMVRRVGRLRGYRQRSMREWRRGWFGVQEEQGGQEFGGK